MHEPWRLGAWEAADRIRNGRLTSTDLVRSCLARIEAVEPVVRAFVDLHADEALERARELDAIAAASRGPLHGVPVVVKEVMDVAGMRCSWGTPIQASRVPVSDAHAVVRLKQAGAVVLGTVTSTEFAIADAPATTNPHDPRRTPGGSSAGSAAAVAVGMVPLALGTQSIGSIVRPSVYCGILGLKPTRGAIPTSGGMPLAVELDHVGPMARHPQDLALACDVLFGLDPKLSAGPDRTAPDAFGWTNADYAMRIDGPLYERVGAPSRGAVARVMQRLATGGAETNRITLPKDFERVPWCIEIILCRGMALHHAAERRHNGGRMSERVRYLIDRGLKISDTEHAEALAMATDFADFLGERIGDDTVVVNAATESVAPLREDGTGFPMLQALWTLIGWPSLALPCGSHDGAPIGIQLVARPGREELLLSTAASLLDGDKTTFPMQE